MVKRVFVLGMMIVPVCVFGMAESSPNNTYKKLLVSVAMSEEDVSPISKMNVPNYSKEHIEAAMIITTMANSGNAREKNIINSDWRSVVGVQDPERLSVERLDCSDLTVEQIVRWLIDYQNRLRSFRLNLARDGNWEELVCDMYPKYKYKAKDEWFRFLVGVFKKFLDKGQMYAIPKYMCCLYKTDKVEKRVKVLRLLNKIDLLPTDSLLNLDKAKEKEVIAYLLREDITMERISHLFGMGYSGMHRRITQYGFNTSTRWGKPRPKVRTISEIAQSEFGRDFPRKVIDCKDLSVENIAKCLIEYQQEIQDYRKYLADNGEWDKLVQDIYPIYQTNKHDEFYDLAIKIFSTYMEDDKLKSITTSSMYEYKYHGLNRRINISKFLNRLNQIPVGCMVNLNKDKERDLMDYLDQEMDSLSKIGNLFGISGTWMSHRMQILGCARTKMYKIPKGRTAQSAAVVDNPEGFQYYKINCKDLSVRDIARQLIDYHRTVEEYRNRLLKDGQLDKLVQDIYPMYQVGNVDGLYDHIIKVFQLYRSQRIKKGDRYHYTLNGKEHTVVVRRLIDGMHKLPMNGLINLDNNKEKQLIEYFMDMGESIKSISCLFGVSYSAMHRKISEMQCRISMRYKFFDAKALI